MASMGLAPSSSAANCQPSNPAGTRQSANSNGLIGFTGMTGLAHT
jgi:hypothetical protein